MLLPESQEEGAGGGGGFFPPPRGFTGGGASPNTINASRHLPVHDIPPRSRE
ncbi:hypothetical protein AG1IA_09486 [Rhizoctonia solani AG-1 IA]|uniref:Uncharacterized protein n=1 Tax=Thanatephorus cucumeris (strain AG1-IA) TaxID=983506 RepID=L8WJD5_THACA|nr:hypothetical protein AG1IA_09486 [Rhizoctonia solani AG-1 IA]